MPGTRCWGLENLFSLPPQAQLGGGGERHTRSHPSSLGGGSPQGSGTFLGQPGWQAAGFQGAVFASQLKDFHSVFQMVIEEVPELEG